MIRFAASLAGALLLASCASTYVSPVEVTRFVGDSPARLGSGTIAVQAAPTPNADQINAHSRETNSVQTSSLEFSAYEQAVRTELARLGYQVVAGQDSASSGAAQVAQLRVTRAARQPGSNRSPVSVGVGGSTGSYGSGLGLGLGIDLSGKPSQIIDTEIGVIIRDTASNNALWEGRASFSASAGSDAAARNVAAQKLASALFSGFPGQSGETIEVK